MADPDHRNGILPTRQGAAQRQTAWIPLVLKRRRTSRSFRPSYGKPLAVVEAKRTKRDPRAGPQQAKLYGDCLEQKFGQRPVIFYSNGYDHWLWDDASYPPRAVQGFLKKDELELLIQRRSTRQSLASATIDPAIVERFYQTRAIRRIETFEKDRARKSLIVMATGAGTTRTVIALCDVLMRCNWAKRVLFLADRIALVTHRLRPDLFGSGKHKEFFYVFDYGQNLEFFSQNPPTTEGASGDSLGKRLFGAR